MVIVTRSFVASEIIGRILLLSIFCLSCKLLKLTQGLSVPFACVGSGDPVRVLHLYTINTLDIL